MADFTDSLIKLMRPEGMLVAPTIKLDGRPTVKNKDNSISTVRSIGVNIGGREILLPTVVGNKVVSDEDAVVNFLLTGEHLGIFDSPKSSDAFAERLHRQQEQMYSQDK